MRSAEGREGREWRRDECGDRGDVSDGRDARDGRDGRDVSGGASGRRALPRQTHQAPTPHSQLRTRRAGDVAPYLRTPHSQLRTHSRPLARRGLMWYHIRNETAGRCGPKP